jgi:hypothetical protein
MEKPRPTHLRIVDNSEIWPGQAQRTEDLIDPAPSQDAAEMMFFPSQPRGLGYRLLELLAWVSESNWRIAGMLIGAVVAGWLGEKILP